MPSSFIGFNFEILFSILRIFSIGKLRKVWTRFESSPLLWTSNWAKAKTKYQLLVQLPTSRKQTRKFWPGLVLRFWAIPGLSFIYFRSFQTPKQLLQKIIVKKYPSWGSNSWLLNHVSPHMTTRPRTKPVKKYFRIILHFDRRGKSHCWSPV